jgi:hypothetical protein
MAMKKPLLEQRKANICFDCKKACGGCSWSAVDPVTRKLRFEPVPGWTAKKVWLQSWHHGSRSREVETYHITACPEFEPDKPRKMLRDSKGVY